MFEQLSSIVDAGVLILIDSNLFHWSVKRVFWVFDPISDIAFHNKVNWVKKENKSLLETSRHKDVKGVWIWTINELKGWFWWYLNSIFKQAVKLSSGK